ncbi:CDP-diacylglycerol--serine O-phosphatidyltransferase [Blastochloris viridis]|uniref:CDP-diacylglycerol--serine O-phosphatidyltransferase n=1 Tax=Blastochloris viridis TaxID=1079 RepID=A0A0H5BD40_BLAVI|nr:CDP-diacylglycerol--serine O-phosphatidyltransferase [Blastochloris viridis]ALK09965.1 CDP-alcohol phosphatidyltransferase [Blastochloris viridis]BAS00121.1 CDP-diacylglycerol--serine O-phosphatidyltransferase [Blastochloris viridis]CUU42628.1 CDP-diacylglycerol-serine O-phosphatidyltransferase [Blastochloris viridis]
MPRFFRSFDSKRRQAPLDRLRRIPLRLLAPNLVTLFTVGLGLTAIRMAADGRFEWATGAIVAAAVLDGVDGRLARWLKGTSRFGAELDSLADFVNFGVAPALILYFWGLHDLKNVGWIAGLLFAIAAALRLARFNVMLEDPNRPAWQGDFFIGVPAPAGAIVVMLPMYFAFLGLPHGIVVHTLAMVLTVAVGILMVSQVPTLSGKKATAKVPREWVLPLLVALVLIVALLVSFPWEVLIVVTLGYLAMLPYGFKLYHRLEAKHGAHADGAHSDVAHADGSQAAAGAEVLPPTAGGVENGRATRLN